tara:strand:+ start:54 stop:383 length:330 start_codon:yes stop_codon:yes gene_type:complete
MAHKGVREFTGEELSGIALGQNGFHVLDAGDHTATSKSCLYWVAIKAVNDDAVVEAQTIIRNSDNLTTDTSAAFGSNPITMLDGDIIYGAFDRIEVASGDYVIAYIGRV